MPNNCWRWQQQQQLRTMVKNMKKFYETTEDFWEIEKELKENGYKKTSDCYWCQIFSNGENEIITERI